MKTWIAPAALLLIAPMAIAADPGVLTVADATDGVPSCFQWEGIWVVDGDPIWYHHAVAEVSWPSTLPLVSYTVTWEFDGTWNFPNGGHAPAGLVTIEHTINGQLLTTKSDTAYPREVGVTSYTIPDGQSRGTTISFTAEVTISGTDWSSTESCSGVVTHPAD